jgi:hypothetical protein
MKYSEYIEFQFCKFHISGVPAAECRAGAGSFLFGGGIISK